MKTCFSEGKLMKQFGNPPLSKRTPPPFQLTPLFLSNFFMTPLFVQISKTRPPPLSLGGGGGKLRTCTLTIDRLTSKVQVKENWASASYQKEGCVWNRGGDISEDTLDCKGTAEHRNEPARQEETVCILGKQHEHFFVLLL